jgi:histone deacetylase complex subunit SAP18
LNAFEGVKVPVPKEEIQIYTWLDANLREISENIQREVENTRKRDTQLQYSLIYPDFEGNPRRKNLGTVKVGSKGPDDMKTLH